MVAVLDPVSKTFLVYIIALDIKDIQMAVHLSQIAQIRLLKAKKALITISTKYSDYINDFSTKLIAKLLKHININDHAIKLEEDIKQLLYGLIYSLKLMELEMLKAHIETNLANGFIRLSKSLAKIPIFFDFKPNRSFCLCID